MSVIDLSPTGLPPWVVYLFPRGDFSQELGHLPDCVGICLSGTLNVCVRTPWATRDGSTAVQKRPDGLVGFATCPIRYSPITSK